LPKRYSRKRSVQRSPNATTVSIEYCSKQLSFTLTSGVHYRQSQFAEALITQAISSKIIQRRKSSERIVIPAIEPTLVLHITRRSCNLANHSRTFDSRLPITVNVEGGTRPFTEWPQVMYRKPSADDRPLRCNGLLFCIWAIVTTLGRWDNTRMTHIHTAHWGNSNFLSSGRNDSSYKDLAN
jgi:hypothetical protein